MAEDFARIERTYTYTYDQFTVFFYEGNVFLGWKEIFHRSVLC